ncbi:FAD binding domain-containing protein [Aspergillus cavernicola]|uniref:FAD binding domain-containing protein n=1 Tax=Aspergillus cavernicola TaxID=176166 RepID=A0ABR4IFT7_9EURO
MDLTNPRSMELLRRLGLADAYRAQDGAVSAHTGFDSIFVTGLGCRGKMLGSWRVPSVDDQRAESRDVNDGSFAVEPGQRCSQIVFERFMRGVVLGRGNVEVRTGWRYIGHVEDGDGVSATFVDGAGQERTVFGRYLVGCDGGSSRVRKEAGIRMVGGQVPARFYLVHFRSTQLAKELQFGRFWHAFPTGSGFVIDQDGKDTFTAHYPLQESENNTALDPREVIHKVLGGRNGPWPINVDEVLVHSEWQPNFSVAETYSTETGRVLLAGDAAHRSPPHGGYGLNSGIVDAVDLSWRLAAVIKGYGGELLLKIYGLERRPMMIRALLRSHRHLMEHIALAEIYQQNWDIFNNDCAMGEVVRALMAKHIAASGPDTLDRGIELDLRYDYSPYVYPDGTPALAWDVKRYQPSTRPGSRAPHVFLKDGTSTYDLFGEEWTLMQFAQSDKDAAKVNTFLEAAKQLGFPLKHVLLQEEDHVRRIWERDLVLVRPDTHVAWRGNEAPDQREADQVLAVVSGRMVFPGYTESANNEEEDRFLRTNMDRTQ